MTQGLPPVSFRAFSRGLCSLLLMALVSACGGGSDASFNNDGVRLLTTIEVTPASAEVPQGGTRPYTATGIYTDGSREDITASAAWSSGNDAVATVDASGLATAVAAGVTDIIAARDGVSGRAEIAVTAATVTRLQIIPPAASIPINTTQDYRAFAVYSDDSVENVTFAAEWELENGSGILAAYDPGPDPASRELDDYGTAVGVAAGEDTLVARFAGLTSRSTITVTAATLESLSISPRDKSTPANTLVAYTATGNYSDGSTVNLTKAVTWSSSDPSVAGISNSDDSRGLASANAPGNTRISASLQGLSDDTGLTVTGDDGDEIVRIDVLPPKATVGTGESLQYTALAISREGRSYDVTSGATWSSNDQGIATVDGAGLAQGASPGSTAISASFADISGSGRLTVRSPATTLDAIVVEPVDSTLTAFTSRQFTATGIYSDGSRRDVTTAALWQSADTDLLVVSNDADFGRGLAFGLRAGRTTISASLTGVSGSTPVTIIAGDAPLLTLSVLPPRASIFPGGSLQYRAELLQSGGEVLDVSDRVSWRSENIGVATIGASGLATGVAEGSALIRATLALAGFAISDTATLDVRREPAVITGIIASPASATIIEGGEQQYRAQALYSDGSSADVSGQVSWSTGDGSIAVIDSSGLATGVAAGTTAVTALLDTGSGRFNSTVSLTVTEPGLTGLVVTPPLASTLPGASVQFTATAQYENGSTVDVTRSVAWQSADPAIAQVDSRGLASGLAPGTAGITATLSTGQGAVSDSAQLQVNAPEISIESLVVDPAAAEVLVGGTRAFSARAILSDGSSQDVTGSVSWASDNRAVATVDGRGQATGIAEGAAGITASLGHNGETFTGSGRLTVKPPPVFVVDVVVAPPTATVLVGDSQPFSARANLSDGSSVDVTGEVSWTTSAPDIAHVDTIGLATGLAEGRSEVIATLLFDGTTFRGSGRLTVESPAVTITEVRVLPPTARVFVGGQQSFAAEAVLSNGNTVDVTRESSWQTEDQTIASVNATGLATGLVSGSTGVVATLSYQGNTTSGRAVLTVDPPAVVPETLLVEPAQAAVLVGSSQSFSAHLLFSDGSQQDVSGQATWISSDSGIAAIDAGGLASGLAPGAVDISARLNIDGTLFSDSGRLRVESPAPVVTGLRVEPAAADILVAGKQQFLALAQLSDGSEIDVSGDVSWQSSAGGIAQVDAGGRATGIAAGQVSITATLVADGSSYSDSAQLTVLPPPVTVLQLLVTPGNAEILIASTVQYRAEAVLSNGNRQDVTDDVSWASGNGSIAQVDSAGLATGLAEGSTTIRALLNYGDGQSAQGSAALTVKAPAITIDSIDVQPATATVAVGAQQRYTATASLSDGSTQDVSREVTWTTVDDTVSSISRGGLATGLAVGTTTVNATLPTDNGPVSDSGEITVEIPPPQLTSLGIFPARASLPLGSTQDYRAYAFYSDGSRQNVTFAGTWSLNIEPPVIAPYTPPTSAAQGSLDDFGTAIAINIGSDRLTFSYDALVTQADVEVTAAALVGLSISPRDESVPIGARTQFEATGSYSDGSSRDVTAAVTWASSDTAVANISNTSPERGLATALALGETTISASLDGASDSTRLRVNGDPVVRLDVAPAQTSLPVGGQQQFAATAIHASGQSDDVTIAATWASDNDSVATITDGGLATGIATGSTVVSASFQGLTDNANLDVTAIALTNIIIEPANTTLLPLHVKQLTAIAYYSDGSHREVTQQATWTSLNPDNVVVSNDPELGHGIVLGLEPGAATVRAALPGEPDATAGTASITVRPLEEGVVKLEVNPPTGNVLTGNTLQYEAILVLDNGIKLDVTEYVTWRSGDTGIATVNGSGLAHGEAAGNTSIAAGIPDSTVAGQASLTVRDPVTVADVVVSPPDARVLVGGAQSYTAVALLSDGRQVDVTADVDWTTGSGAIAKIQPDGVATGLSPGSTGVVATLDVGGSLTQGTAQLDVLPVVTVEELVVSPPTATILEQDQLQFRATLRLSDGRSIEVTDSATWQSSNGVVAQVAPGGLATGKSAGSATINATATYEGQSYTSAAQLTVTAITVDYIQISPRREQTVAGGTVQFTASAVMTDATVQDITRLATWFVQDTGIAAIESGKKAGFATGLAPGNTLVYVEYSDNGSPVTCLGEPRCEAVLEVVAPRVVDIQVTPSVAEMTVGGGQQYTATAILDNGGSVDATSAVSWRSSDKTIAAVGVTGLARGIGAGSVQISATLVDDGGNAITGTASLTVTAPPVTIDDLRVTPEQKTILTGDKQQYKATALLSDGGAIDVTDQAAWSSSLPAVAHVNDTGLATGLAAGSTTISATVNLNGETATGSTGLTVNEPIVLTQLEVLPRSESLVAGDSLQYRAIAVFSDSAVKDVTAEAIWRTSDTAVATINSGPNGGLATGTAAGSVTVWADYSYDGATYPCASEAGCRAQLTVEDPITAIRIDVKPQSETILIGNTAQFTADLVFSNGNVVDATDTVTWRSADTAIAAPQNTAGQFIGIAEGTVTVSASGSFDGSDLSGNATLTVAPPAITVDRLEVVPATGRVFVGDSGNFQAVAYLSNGEVHDVTLASVWRSSDTAVGVIEPDTGFGRALSPGQTVVTASFTYEGTVSVGESQITVTEAQPNLLEVAPASAYLPAGDRLQYSAILHYEDGREEPVTDSVSWESASTSIATVSNAPGNEGEVTGVSQGITGIRAVHGSGLEAAGALEVIAPTLVSLVIDPAGVQLVEGQTRRLFALATFSDDSVLIVSPEAAWSSDNNTVASVADDAQQGGVVSANRAGTATVTAVYQGLTATSAITVQANILVSGWIEPGSNTLQVGDEADYRAFGTFLDGSNREITTEATWQTSNAAVATVGNGGAQPKGRVLALAGGSTDIFATFDGVQVGRSPLTVEALTTVGLVVSPASTELRPGGTGAFTATATYDNGSSADVTALAIWGTANSNVAVISNEPGSAGIATAVNQGITTVTARYDGLQGTASLAVSSGSCQGKPGSIVIDAGDQTVPEGQTVRFTARGIYDDGCNQDITHSNQTVWQSLNPSICKFQNPKGGIAVGVQQGVATVEAKHRGVTDTATCTVTPRIQ